MILKKVFFGCNLSSLDRSGNQNDYANHIKVTINSCIKNTNLDIHFMHCGKNEELFNWLKSKPIKLIDVSDFDLFNILPNYCKGGGLTIARGAWQRMLVPQVCRQLGVADTHVLYTDIDVIFTSNIERPINLNIDKFACALERGAGRLYNTGVMIINTAYFDSIYEPLMDFAKSRNFRFRAFDQGALNAFVPKNRITILDHHEWNFAPHMHGDCKQSRIIHFHGPKANQIDFYLKGGAKKEFNHGHPDMIWNLLDSSNKNTLSLIIDLYNSHLDINN